MILDAGKSIFTNAMYSISLTDKDNIKAYETCLEHEDSDSCTKESSNGGCVVDGGQCNLQENTNYNKCYDKKDKTSCNDEKSKLC